MQRLLPPILLIIAALLMFKLHWLCPLTQAIPAPINWIGSIPLMAGLFIAAWHSRLFKRLGTNIHTFGEPDRLVTEGMFRFSRNPMYLGFVLALAGLAILLGSASPWLVVAGFLIITDRWYITYEEAVLADKFGDSYRNYQSRVRRWI